MLTQVRLRTKFLTLLLLGVLAVTVTTLLVVRGAVENQIRTQISGDLRNSVLTFKAFQGERETTLSHSAELLADLPTVKAEMSTEDVATIQDASKDTWRLSGSDLLVLAEPAGRIMAVHATARELSRTSVQEALTRSAHLPDSRQWWFLDGNLYEVFLQPIYSGPSREDQVKGILALGYEINQGLATDVSRITGSQVTFLYGDSVVATTIDTSRHADFAQKVHDIAAPANPAPEDLQLSDERYLGASVELAPGATPGARLIVLKSYDEATARLRGLYRVLAGLGILALFGVSLLAFAIFRRYTRPLEELMAGVRALGRGDFGYPLAPHGNDELAEATASFIRMRDDLQATQRKLLESERLATMGRMASSISHDLRHQLTSIVANSEFLSEPDLDRGQSEELYQEIRDAVGRMTELIDSLLEFSKGRDALSLSYGSLEETMQRAIRAVHSHPAVQNVNIMFHCHGNREGWFDSKRLERAFYNLLLNACQASSPAPCEIEVVIQEKPHAAEIWISDSGPGIPEHVRNKIFEPFFSFAKENGTGLGLTIVQKILEEHGGSIALTDSSPGHTTFRMVLPLVFDHEGDGAGDMSSVNSDNNITSAH
ncbi:MAG TPA: ATP-binding protein [Candidatus Angelobacter sp.]|nr:ATP-binding protein [Candidatus Angelobacter sp.]